MIGKLVYENIRHRAMRTVLSTLLIGVPVMLILIIKGLSVGLVEDAKNRAGGVGADVIVRAPGSSAMTLSGVTIPEQLATKLASRPHVAMAMGTVNQSGTALFDTITGIDTQKFNRMSGGFEFLEGRDISAPDDVLLDNYFADQKHAHLGDSITLTNHVWKIVGIVQPGKLSHIFVDMKRLQDLTGTEGRLSVIYLKADDPKNTSVIINSLNAEPTLQGYKIYAMREFTDLISVNNVPMLPAFLNVIIGISIFISFAVVSLSMYMAVLQRTREIGILKAIGASKTFILTLILAESVIIGFGGAVVGILFSFASHFLLLKFVPSSLPQAIVTSWWPVAGAVVLAGSILGALYPGLNAAQQDPIEALAYE